MYLPSEPAYGIESSFCKAAMARSGSPICAATRARISIGLEPVIASFSIGFAAIARSTELTRRLYRQGPYWSARDRQ